MRRSGGVGGKDWADRARRDLSPERRRALGSKPGRGSPAAAAAYLSRLGRGAAAPLCLPLAGCPAGRPGGRGRGGRGAAAGVHPARPPGARCRQPPALPLAARRPAVPGPPEASGRVGAPPGPAAARRPAFPDLSPPECSLRKDWRS